MSDGILFGMFMQRVEERLVAIEGMEAIIVSEVQDLQAKVDALTQAASDAGVDFTELTGRVDQVIDAISAQIPALQAANEELTAQRDALQNELGSDHAAVSAANAAVDANTSTINALGDAMDAYRAEVASTEPTPTEGTTNGGAVDTTTDVTTEVTTEPTTEG